MKKILASMLAIFGISSASAQENKVQLIDPKEILFTVPTISNDLAPMAPVTEALSASDYSFHEDDWSQLEFFPKSQLKEVQRLLSEYKPFEERNRVKQYWKNTYVRKIERLPVVAGENAASDLSRALGAELGPAPVLYKSSAITGRVISGFTISLGGNITMYGYSNQSGIPVLGVMVGENPNDQSQRLIQAFSVLNEKYGLLLVDWRQQLLIVGRGADDSLSLWRP